MTSTNVTVRDLEIMKDANNYHGWIYDQISEYLGQRIIEMGGGIGISPSLEKGIRWILNY